MKRGVLAFLIAAFCFLSTASAQDRAGQAGGARGGRGGAPPVAVERKLPPKPKPVGAWWYTGETPPPMQDGHPDLTGVWFGDASGDLSKTTLPGQGMTLTPYGKQRYDTVGGYARRRYRQRE